MKAYDQFGRRVTCIVCGEKLPPPKEGTKPGGRPRILCLKASCQTEHRKARRAKAAAKRRA